jgi:hypothetical protein
MKSVICVGFLSRGVYGTTAKCQNLLYPSVKDSDDNAIISVTVDPYKASKTASVTSAEYAACPASTPALLTTAAALAGTDDMSGGADDTKRNANKAACCIAAVKCSTSYQESDGTDAAIANKCKENSKLQSDQKCTTVDAATPTACGAQVAASDVDVDTNVCCKQKCNGKYGYEQKDGSDNNKQKCDDSTKGTFKISDTHTCKGDTCGTDDKATCCLKKCTDGVVLFGETVENLVNVACSDETADKINPTGYCKGSTCKTSDTQCCLQKCSDGFELFGGTTDKMLQCADGLTVSTDEFCTASTCKASDKKKCCLEKCTAEKGFEVHSTTKNKDKAGMCAKDLRVHPTGLCKEDTCKTSSSICCQQKCSKGFKLKGAAGAGTECGKDLTVSTTAYCTGSSCKASDAGTCCQQKCSKGWKLNGATTTEANTCAKETTVSSDGKCAGSPCAATDSKACCNEKCSDKKLGFKVNGGTGKEPFECKKGEVVASKGVCSGDCSSDDAKTCCMAANNSSATTDANGVGLAATAGVLVILSAALG